MKKTIVVLCLLFNSLIISAQNYNVEWGTSTYDTLTNYTSILYEILDEPLINGEEYSIDFPFSFPFFDQNYNYVTIDGSGYGYFYDIIEEYQLTMFAGDFERHFRLPIFSDWRIRTDTVGIDIVKVEWRNVGIYDDIWSDNPTSHWINYQVWFYENGIIEYRFGDINLANTPFYDSNTGFIWDDGECYGPWIGIQKTDESEVYYVSGTNFNTHVITDPDSMDIFYDIPPFGRYFRFVPDEFVKAVDLPADDITVYPIPAKDRLNISTGNKGAVMTKTEIYSLSGTLLTSDDSGTQKSIDVRKFPSGAYFVKLYFIDGTTVGRKFFK